MSLPHVSSSKWPHDEAIAYFDDIEGGILASRPTLQPNPGAIVGHAQGLRNPHGTLYH